jgi:hypothetical protein
MDEFRDFRAYLDEKFKHLELAIADVKATTAGDIQRLRNDISELYEKDREMRDKVSCIAARVGVLEDDKSQHSDDRRFTLALIGLIISFGLAVAGWLL